MATAGLLRGHFVPSALCFAQRLSLSNICLGRFGKWNVKAREKGMTSCLLLEVELGDASQAYTGQRVSDGGR